MDDILTAVIADDVRSAFATLPTDEMTIGEVHSRLESTIPQLSLAAIDTLFSGAITLRTTHYANDHQGNILFEKTLYQVLVVPHASKTSALVITIRPVTPREISMDKKRSHIDLDCLGRYRSVHLYAPSTMAHLRERILNAVSTVLRVAYDWLFEKTMRRMRGISDVAAKTIYTELRRTIPSELVDQVWVYGFSGGQGFYMPDPIAQDVAITRLRERDLHTTRSPLNLAVDFMTRIVPIEQTIIKDVIAARTHATGYFAEAPYAGDGFAVAEQSIYKSNGVVAQPLARLGDAIIATGYPAALASDLTPRLSAIAPSIESALTKCASDIDQQLADLRSLIPRPKTRTSEWTEVMELKPNIFGIGINGNAILNWFMNRNNKPK